MSNNIKRAKKVGKTKNSQYKPINSVIAELITKPEKIITEKRQIGNLGEDIACTYLTKHGFVIFDRNYLKKYGELDIVAGKEGITHFIEVKTVSRGTGEERQLPAEAVIHETSEYRAEDNVHPAKLKRIARTMQAYIAEKKISHDWQFDVITVQLNMKTRLARVTFMENIIM